MRADYLKVINPAFDKAVAALPELSKLAADLHAVRLPAPLKDLIPHGGPTFIPFGSRYENGFFDLLGKLDDGRHLDTTHLSDTEKLLQSDRVQMVLRQLAKLHAGKLIKKGSSAVLVTGNPKYIEGNAAAEKFYRKLERLLQQSGYETSRDPGEPFTEPKPADVWIGHSRGAGRLRFAPPGTTTVALGVPDAADYDTVVNHRKDISQAVPGDVDFFGSGISRKELESRLGAERAARYSPDAHFKLTPAMARRIREAITKKAADESALPIQDDELPNPPEDAPRAMTAGQHYSSLSKQAVLGFPKLTGHTGPIKDIIRAARNDGVKITRVKPEAPEARLPHTEHLPVGESSTGRGLWQADKGTFRNEDITVLKGKPRITFDLDPPDELGRRWIRYANGTPGGTNPSPIASFLHEYGHLLHHRGMRQAGLGDIVGGHSIPGAPYQVEKVFNEVGANNAALQALKQRGARPDALKMFSAARYPSFLTYTQSVPAHTTHPAWINIQREAPRGSTKSLTGLPGLYKGAHAQALQAARKATNTDPTEAQKHEGNYAKGELTYHGMTIKLENPKGSYRSGKDKSGTPWRNKMFADYGYFKGTKAVDGDAVDCFIGPDLDSEFVAVIDQYEGDKFDESKFVLGCKTKDQASALYLKHYPKDWKLGPVSSTTVHALKEWLKTPHTKKPFAGQTVKAASTFVVSGEKTQGMGLRKLYHKILEERGLRGVAVNNPHTNEVELSLDAEDPHEVLSELVARVKQEKNRKVDYRESEHNDALQPIRVSDKALDKLRHAHFNAYVNSPMFDPENGAIFPFEEHKSMIAERYRLKPQRGGLVGHVPPRAADQLLGREMPYSWMPQPREKKKGQI